MTTHQSSLFDDKTNPAPNAAFKQKLLAPEQTSDGIRITRLKRRFYGKPVNSRFENEPLSLTQTKQSAFALALFYIKVFIMQIEVFKKQVKLLSIVVDECKKHPAYRATRLAAACSMPCAGMWQARQGLKELDK